MEFMYSEETGSIEIEDGSFSLLTRAKDVVTVQKRDGTKKAYSSSIKLTFRNGQDWQANCSTKDMNMIFDTLRDMIDPVDEECDDDEDGDDCEDGSCCCIGEDDEEEAEAPPRKPKLEKAKKTAKAKETTEKRAVKTTRKGQTAMF